MIREASAWIRCRGDRFVSATHPSTLEITRHDELTLNGDCIIGIDADCGARDLPENVRSLLCNNNASIQTILSCEGMNVEINARGSSAFTLDHPTDMVWRRSGYVCGRTVAIYSDTTARTIPRNFIEALRKGYTMIVDFRVTVRD